MIQSDCRLDYIQQLQNQVHNNPDTLLDVRKEEEPEQAPTTSRVLPFLCSIPSRTLVSPSLGGTPVTPQLTENLRRILFGGTFHVFGYEWRRSLFQFRDPGSEMAYSLEIDQGGPRPIQTVVQARIIKHLLFNRQSGADERTSVHSLRDISQRDQERALATALTDSLWLAGQEITATVTLLTMDYCIPPPLDYKLDNFTEKLQLFTFNDKDAVQTFILQHIHCFTEEGSHGIVLFLYSLICSRTVERLRDDLDLPSSHLLYVRRETFVCCQALLNLLLTGRASSNVFNGTIHLDEDGLPLQRPLQGVLNRCDIGFLTWSREQMECKRLPQVGSMLKTPRFPVWVCSVNGSYSVLFSSNRSLLSDWKTEHLFHLYLCTGQTSQKTTTRLTIDTHSHHWEVNMDMDQDPEKRFPSLEMTIRTKWNGAAVNWNGATPFY